MCSRRRVVRIWLGALTVVSALALAGATQSAGAAHHNHSVAEGYVCDSFGRCYRMP